MVDPGVAQAIVRQLNRWYRKRAKSRGTVDYYHRGTRMNYTTVSRIVPCCFAILSLAVAAALFFIPDLMSDKPSLEVLAVKIGCLGIAAVALLAPLQMFRECAVISDDGLLKSNLFGRQTRMAWTDIFTFRINSDDNKVTFQNKEKAKLTMSLAYDGWQEFLELAARHMNRPLYRQFQFMLTNLDAKHPVFRSTKKSRRAKWFSFGRSS